MSRMIIPGSTLPPRTKPTAAIAIVLFSTIAISMFAYITSNTVGAVLIGILGALLIAGTVALYLRNRERHDDADLFLHRVHGILGWPDPHRGQVVPSKYRGGWVGKPTQLKVVYNPLADEEVPEMLAEIRRLAKRQFGSAFKVAKHKKSTVIMVASGTSAVERDRDEKIERSKLIVAKTFGSSANTTVATEPVTRQVDGKTITSTKVTRISVKYEVAPKLSRSGVRASVESQISGVLEGRWRAFWDLPNDTFWMEPRPELPNVIPNPFVAPETVDPLATYDDLAVPVAIDEDGNVISWRPKQDPHFLTTGKTGKGKTVCELGVIGFLAAHGWEIWGIDGKRFEMLGLRTWPNVKLIAGRIDHQARVAHEVYEEMQRRMAAYEAGSIRLEEFVPILFVIDEFKTFRNALLRWYRMVKPRGAAAQPPVLDEISDIASLGRKMRIHIMNGLQRPDADFLTGDMRDNYTFRASWGRLSAEAAKMMWNNYTTGTTIPTTAKGRGIAYNKQGQAVEVQGFWTPDPYQTDAEHPERWVFPGDLQLVENMRPKKRIHDIMKIVDLEDDVIDVDEKGKPIYADYGHHMATPIINAGDPELIERERKILGDAEGDIRREKLAAQVALLERIQIEEEEPEISDEAEMFSGYSPAIDQFPEELLVDGELRAEGILILVDEDSDTWGLVEFAEEDEEDITFSYRDFATGDPGSKTIPTGNTLITRSPVSAEN
ncbi:FtsK/SpoIIIE domain-containing protein [Microbacterium alcoholitolerans]|uniref:FtsK/SpoIIIE domain-containing protein n=1 Tax=unclassified Microbacterium TaxID=2609290 RepID=UPI003D17D96B